MQAPAFTSGLVSGSSEDGCTGTLALLSKPEIELNRSVMRTQVSSGWNRSLGNLWRASVLAMLGASILSAAVTLPDGPGKSETTRVCSKCHSLDQSVSIRQAQSGWKETVSKMINLGAEGSDVE